jgi:hypothetical protein
LRVIVNSGLWCPSVVGSSPHDDRNGFQQSLNALSVSGNDDAAAPVSCFRDLNQATCMYLMVSDITRT